MFRQFPYVALLAVSVLAGAATLADRTAPTVSAQTSAAQNQTTLDDQTELALTVYNSDIALVRDVRNLQLPRGTFKPPVHGHRRDGQSGHGALQVAF